MVTTRPGPGATGTRPADDALPWSRNDALVTIGVAALDLIGFSLTSQSELGHVSVGGCLLVVAIALPLLARRRAPVPALAAIVALGLVLNLTVSITQHFTAAVVVGLYTVVRSCRPAVVTASLLGVLLLLSDPASWPRPSLMDGLSNIAAAVIVVVAAVEVGRWQRDAEARRRGLADRAVAAERRRIARELHDIVAHHITTMQLMAGGARANLARDPEVAREALLTLEGSGRTALHEMRQLLDVLRAGDDVEDEPTQPQPGVDDLERIVAESCRAGLPTALAVRGEKRPLPPSVGLTVFRIVQESLTNARKHAGTARAEVRLTYEPRAVSVEVSDDGTGAGPARTGGGTGSGYGLMGMRERAVLHGGTLEAGPLDGAGFRVAATLPLAVGQGAL
ncbi:sensor histidine kinase [Streptomyces sp. NBC_00083]|uniref:sensor histidine kinase n=1 Tax=Streptomyces sp. NBC_00083 TaxID=2975647 RepID=UPI002256E72C|nr:sensor histidine kinase [Streptomyces sp. NBC_00083]MCX5387206.1 sensor histidine kinase [Streptomyces sp. NBC_00083]